MNFDKGSKGRDGGGHWGPGGKYNPDNSGCGKQVAKFVAVVAIIALIVWQVA